MPSVSGCAREFRVRGSRGFQLGHDDHGFAGIGLHHVLLPHRFRMISFRLASGELSHLMPAGRLLPLAKLRVNPRLLPGAQSFLFSRFLEEYIMRTWFCWVVLAVFASLSLCSVAFATGDQTTVVKKQTTPSHKKTSAAKAKSLTALAALPAVKPHRIVIQVDQDDPAVMNLALNNATNFIDYYRAQQIDVEVDLVTYGSGLHMLRDDTSPVKDRIKQLKDFAFPSTVQFSACNNTKENMEKKEGKPVTIISDAVLVPSGVVHLSELQEKGWTYLKP
jgi:uncharacterized protein